MRLLRGGASLGLDIFDTGLLCNHSNSLIA
jgi:hypothetical protein